MWLDKRAVIDWTDPLMVMAFLMVDAMLNARDDTHHVDADSIVSALEGEPFVKFTAEVTSFGGELTVVEIVGEIFNGHHSTHLTSTCLMRTEGAKLVPVEGRLAENGEIVRFTFEPLRNDAYQAVRASDQAHAQSS